MRTITTKERSFDRQCEKGSMNEYTKKSKVTESVTLPENPDGKTRLSLKRSFFGRLGSLENLLPWLDTSIDGSFTKILDLSDCSMGDNVVQGVLIHLLTSNLGHNLVEIDLSGNCIHASDSGFLLGQLLNRRPSLHCLRLDRNEIDADFVRALCHVPDNSLRHISSERTIDLYLFGNRLGDEGVSILAESHLGPHFRLLRLGSNGLQAGSAKGFAKLFTQHRLEHVDLFANFDIFRGPSDCYNEFRKTLPQSNLQHLCLSMCSMSDISLVSSIFLNLPPTLQCLQVNNSLMPYRAYEVLALRIAGLPRLHCIALDTWPEDEALERTWKTALFSHTVLSMIKINQRPHDPKWEHFISGICIRNSFIRNIESLLYGPPLRPAVKLLIVERMISSMNKGLGRSDKSALFFFVRECLAHSMNQNVILYAPVEILQQPT